jgi:hypothetical protein
VVEDVLFEKNVVRDTEGVFNILGYDNNKPSGCATRITIQHNLAVGSGVFLIAGGEVGTLTINHNTVDQGYNFMTLYRGDIWLAGAAAPRGGRFAVEYFTVTNNLANHNDYGVFGEDAGIGTPALAQLSSVFSWTNNVLAGEAGFGRSYPPVTWQPTMAEYRAQFQADYQLIPQSVFRKAGTDGRDLGVVWEGAASQVFPQPPRNVRVTKAP